MAVKASAQITLTYVVDVKAYYRYYLLQSSTAATPSKPTTFSPSSSWDDAEPTYTEGSTNSLYFVDCTVFNDDTFKYSEVSLSSAYESAKLAYNKATNAQNTANSANNKIDNLEIGGRNLLLNTNATDGSAITVSGVEPSISGCTWTNEDGVLTLNGSATDREIYYRFMPTNTGAMYTLEPGNDYTISGQIKVSTTSGTLQYVSIRSQHNNGVSWIGGLNEGAATQDSDEWISFEYTHSIPADAVSAYFSIQVFYTTSWTGTVQCTKLKLEKGNRATDWTPAPEDMATNDDLDNVRDTANDAQSRVNTAELDIDAINGALSTLVIDDAGTTILNQTGEGWTFNMGNVMTSLNNAYEALTNIEHANETTNNMISELESLIDDLNARTAYIDMNYDDQNNPILELGRRNDNDGFKVTITNSTILFKLGTSASLRLENRDGVGYVVTDKIIIEEEFQFGKFIWIDHSGSMGLMWKGDES